MSYTTNEVYSLLSQIQNNQNDGGYQTQILNNYQQLMDTVSKENSIMNSTFKNKWTFNSAAGQQSKYIYQSSTILTKLYTYGFWIYLVLAVILCVIIWMKPDTIYMKVFLVAAILLYPFYIYPLEELSYIVSTYIWALLLSTTYDNGYGNTSIEYGLNGTGGENGLKGSKGNRSNVGDSEEINGSQDNGIGSASAAGSKTTSTTGPKENPPASTTTPAFITSTPSPLPIFSYDPVPITTAEETPQPTTTAEPAVDFMDDTV
jgi:hypothetical protein